MSYSTSPSNDPPLRSIPPANSPSSSQKADQLVHRLFIKVVNVVTDARSSSYTSAYSTQPSSPYDSEDPSLPLSRTNSTAGPSAGRNDRQQPRDIKVEKWFNIEIPDYAEQFKAELEVFRRSSSLNQIPTLFVNVLLVVPASLSTQTGGGVPHGHNVARGLVHRFTPSALVRDATIAADTRVTRITPTPRIILLETHTLSYSGESMLSSGAVEPAQVYKQAISMFRSFYTLLRTLPSWKLRRTLRRNRSNASSSNLSIEVQLTVGRPIETVDDMIVGFDGPQSQPPASLTTEFAAFPPLATPIGSFTLHSVYRPHANYSLDTLESLLSQQLQTPSPPLSQQLADLRGNRARTSTNGASGLTSTRREPVNFTPTLATARDHDRTRRESFPSTPSSSRSPLPQSPFVLPSSERVRASPLPPLDLQHGPSPHVGSAPISMPMRHQLSSTAANPPSPTSSISSSPRPRRISALGSVSSQSIEFPAHLGTGGHLVGTSASGGNSSPRFGFLSGRDPSDLPFAVGHSSGRTSASGSAGGGALERTRKESLLGSSSVSAAPISTSITNHGRRPSITSIHPFKSATVASSPSSASFRGPSSFPHPAPSPSPSPFIPTHSANPSTTSLREPRLSTPGGATRPISVLEAATTTSPEQRNMQLSTTRYSSTFGNRGTPLSLGRDPSMRHMRNASNDNVGVQSEDDELSAFVRLIDTRAPLRGGHDDAPGVYNFPSLNNPASPRSPLRQLPSTPPSPLDASPYHSEEPRRSATVSYPSVLTSRADVDETLRRMTESFRAGMGSLEPAMRARRTRTESEASALGSSSDRVRTIGAAARTSPLLEEDIFSAGGESPVGRGLVGRMSNLSSSSLFAGGRRSYDSGEQIVGRIDLTDREDDGARQPPPSSRRSDTRPSLDPNARAPFAQQPRRI